MVESFLNDPHLASSCVLFIEARLWSCFKANFMYIYIYRRRRGDIAKVSVKGSTLCFYLLVCVCVLRNKSWFLDVFLGENVVVLVYLIRVCMVQAGPVRVVVVRAEKA